MEYGRYHAKRADHENRHLLVQRPPGLRHVYRYISRKGVPCIAACSARHGYMPAYPLTSAACERHEYGMVLRPRQYSRQPATAADQYRTARTENIVCKKPERDLYQ